MKKFPFPSIDNLPKREFFLLCAAVMLHVAFVIWVFFTVGGAPSGQQIDSDSISVELRTAMSTSLSESKSVSQNQVPENFSPPPKKSTAPIKTAPKVFPPSSITTNNANNNEPPNKQSAESYSLPVVNAPSNGRVAAAQGNAQMTSLNPGVPNIFKVNPPPSAKLQYRAQAVQNGKSTYGNGNIFWQSNGKIFSIQGEFNIASKNALLFSSEGIIDPEYGVSPMTYIEKPQQDPPINVHFHRDRNTVNFSSTTESRALNGGEQDRASAIWQLVGMGRQDSGKFMPDAKFELSVVGVRQNETWQIQVVGQEELDTPVGKLQVWHLIHTPPTGSNEQTLDIWLAPEKDWYPVKLRYSAATGDYFELFISEIVLTPNR